MTGRDLEARKKDGSLIRTFYPAELGDNIYSISPLRGDAVKALAANLPGLLNITRETVRAPARNGPLCREKWSAVTRPRSTN
jgi:hypothetical protein